MSDISKIIEKAAILSKMIEENGITIKYNASLEKMKSDKKAQDLLTKLVMLGRDINEKMLNNENPIFEAQAEKELILKELEENPIVKEHVLIEKEYISMISQIQDKIKNPD
jgi:cell fate (sporulation/competence/biofilm development) regulator YlbF (YheA/YmcA/DUF963 family)